MEKEDDNNSFFCDICQDYFPAGWHTHSYLEWPVIYINVILYLVMIISLSGCTASQLQDAGTQLQQSSEVISAAGQGIATVKPDFGFTILAAAALLTVLGKFISQIGKDKK